MTITELKSSWQDTPEHHQNVHETLFALVRLDEQLNTHRNFVEQNVWGFGERSFWWVWKLILAELPKNPALLEVGCFKGATLSVWKLLRPDAKVFGITPLSNEGLQWTGGDYAADIATIHDKFELKHPHIFKGLSEDKKVIDAATSFLYDIGYVDGGHERRHIDNDLLHYAPCVKKGGWLVIDDAATFTNQPFGYFQGIKEVSEGLRDWLKTDIGQEFEFYFNVVHLMVYRRK